MIVADARKNKEDRTLEQWVQEESAMVALAILHRLPPAVRQAMTTLEAIETGAQAIATLRAIHRSGHWQAFWRKGPWAPLVPLARRIAA